VAYLDHAASTPLRIEALDAMEPFLAGIDANPSGMHTAARAAKTALEAARENVAELLGCQPREVVFTGGGSEGDNLAVKGAAWAARDKTGRDGGPLGVVTTAIEHKAVLGACSRLEREGFRVQRIGATPGGAVDRDALRAALDEQTAVVSVMLVNNETGVIQPLPDVIDLVRERAPRAVVHTDAVQAVPWLDLRGPAADAHLISISAHKFGGPKGVGALVVRDGVDLVPLVDGGGHEGERRAGTQNVAGIVGLAAALRAVHDHRDAESARIGRLRDALEAGLRAARPDLEVNGDVTQRVRGILNCAFPSTESETLLVALDQREVFAASGSACSSGATDPSHVLLAMGLGADRALASVRFSLGHTSTRADVDAALAVVPDAVRRLIGAAA
jgi:cysteine desulfurase